MKFKKTVREEINFWPGYVDALINVVLNLLFLVGIFIVGLVSFNSVALSVHRQAVQWRLSDVLDKPAQQARQDNARALLAGVDRKGPEVALPPPQVQPKPLTPPMAKPLPVPAMPPSLPPAVLPLPEPVAAALPPTPVIREIRIAREAAASASRLAPGQGGVQSAARDAEQMSGGKAVAQLRFAINQYTVPEGSTLSAALAQNPDALWQLVVLTDPANDRLSREAYARLIAVRDQMLASGVPSERVQLRIVAAPTPSAELDRTLFLVARPR